jgi:hypothetical protein
LGGFFFDSKAAKLPRTMMNEDHEDHELISESGGALSCRYFDRQDETQRCIYKRRAWLHD